MSKNVNNNSLEIIVQTKELAYVLSFAASVVEKRNVVSELSNVKLVARDGILEIGATDLDLYLNQTIGAEVKKEGQSTVSTKNSLKYFFLRYHNLHTKRKPLLSCYEICSFKNYLE